MLLFSVHRCASCPRQLLAIPKVARETLQWKILGNLRVPERQGPVFRLKPETETVSAGLQEAHHPPAHFLKCAPPTPPPKDEGLTKFSSDGEVSGRSATKKPKTSSVRERK